MSMLLKLSLYFILMNDMRPFPKLWDPDFAISVMS